MAEKTIDLAITLTEPRAYALVQLCKRFGYEDAVRMSNQFDEGKERDLMLDAIIQLGGALMERGIVPR